MFGLNFNPFWTPESEHIKQRGVMTGNRLTSLNNVDATSGKTHKGDH